MKKAIPYQILHYRRVGALFVVMILLLIMAVFSTKVFADQLVERSIALSSASIKATNVTYTTKFTAAKAAGAFVVDFCTNSPLAGQTCEAPEGLSTAGVSSSTPDFTDVSALSANSFLVAGSMSASQVVTVAISHMTNPKNAGTIYARIVTYDTKAHAQSYESENLHAGVVDTGSVAIPITNTIAVSAYVPESMLFCVSGETIAENCGATVAPELKLGEKIGNENVLSTEKVSTAQVHTQISTNAISGAVIRLKSTAAGCGGFIRSDDKTACDIAPALKTDIQPGEAKFGIKTAVATDASATSSGMYESFPGSGYNGDTFALNYADGDATGVTSIYGDPILSTGGAPVNNKNMLLTFGASKSDITPAGDYSVGLSLIATGKF